MTDTVHGEADQQAEIALRRANDRFRAAINAVQGILWTNDAAGRMVGDQSGWAALTGQSAAEYEGYGWAKAVHPDDTQPTIIAWSDSVARCETFVFEHRVRRHDGVWRLFSIRAVPLLDPDGLLREWVGVHTDITDQRAAEDGLREAERALQKLNHNLEAQVAERTAELTSAKIAAEAGARVKAEFLANMSHELRTPLTGMLGVHDLLHSDPSLSDRQRHFVDLAQDSGRALLTIVNDILDFSKIEAGQMVIERVPFRLRELVENCRQLGAEAVKLKSVDFAVEVDAAVPDLFLGDPTRIRQVLLNLITNAIKFTSQGKVTINAHWSGRHLRLEVIDSGIGVPAEVIPHLFERFSQADGSTARRFGGTGLGLAICKRLVELMDGTIGVESVPSLGSTFWFSLPLKPAECSQRPEPRENPLATAPRRAWRVLVAEDNVLNQEIIRTVLTQKGFAVTIVDDGAKAVLAFREGVFDVVLMDIQMPRVDGLSATQEIRTIEQTETRARTPVVALTANVMAEEAERCRQAGMDAHVAKPINWTQLFSTIDRLCGQQSAPAVVEAGLLAVAAAGALVLDENALDSLASLLGRERIVELLLSFERDARRRLGLIEGPSATSENIAQHAHALVSLAGQLGFAELSSFCAGLEAAALQSREQNWIEALRVVVNRALEAASRSSYAPGSIGTTLAASNT